MPSYSAMCNTIHLIIRIFGFWTSEQVEAGDDWDGSRGSDFNCFRRYVIVKRALNNSSSSFKIESLLLLLLSRQ